MNEQKRIGSYAATMSFKILAESAEEAKETLDALVSKLQEFSDMSHVKGGDGVKVKQGHTKFQVVVYEPGKIEGYDDRHVACIYTCFVTKVGGDQISYSTENYPYLCGPKFWSKLFPTRRKALRYAQERIDKINKLVKECA